MPPYFFYASLPNFTTEFYFVKLDNLFFVYNMTVHPCTVYFFRHPCLEINESFLQSKKLSDKSVYKIFIGDVPASLFFLASLPNFTTEFYSMTLTESVLEDEGMHVFEWWGGEYHPLEELIAEMDEVKQNNK